MRIADISLVEVIGHLPQAYHWANEWHVGMLSTYPEFAGPPSRKPRRGPSEHHAIYVEIKTDEALTGRYGPIYAEQAFLIQRKFKGFLVGRDPGPIDVLWDQMYRKDRHGRTGFMMMAISAIDNALWDLKGKAESKPVCRLLADEIRDTLPCYCSVNNYPDDSGPMADFARNIQSQGFTAQKWFFRAGPASGAAGAETNLQMARTVREAVGNDDRIMYDCWNSWDEPFADRMAPGLAELHPFFVEECFPSHFVDSFERLHAKHPHLPLATGEHLFTRWEVKPFLERELLRVVQADPDWCGGISELLEICRLAAQYGVQVIPHGHSAAAAIQVVAAQPNTLCPLCEYLPPHLTRQQYFHKHRIEPENGILTVPDAPGLALELDEARVEERREWEP